MRQDYEGFLRERRQLDSDDGFDPIWLPDWLFGFQDYLDGWAIRKGRAEIMADCGMGKTLMQLVWAENTVRKTNRPALVIAPLAVGYQTVDEADKFGIEAEQSRDGSFSKKIVVTNYERLHYFDRHDFAAVVGDECFPAGTSVETPLGLCNIENLQPGDLILNASGIDEVSDIHRREVPYAVAFVAGGKRITASPNHPVFTGRGWVASQDLEPGDCILQTRKAVRMVRQGVSSARLPGVWSCEILREILLSEMANETTAAYCQGSYSGSSDKEGEVTFGAISKRRLLVSGKEQGTDSQSQSDAKRRGKEKSLPHIETYEAQTFRTWRKRQGNDSSAEAFTGCSRQWMGPRIELIVGQKESRLSHCLQSRLGERREKSRYRGGWKLPLFPKGTGQKEGCDAGFVRVDSLEILEQGHPELERLRDADGKLYFYDIGGTRHPSYSVSGLLVHNSSILKNFDGKTRKAVTEFMRGIPYRLLCTATAAPNDYHELGTSSEALGYLGYQDMLSRFFKEDVQKDHLGWGRKTYRFRGHAEEPFWRWICSWARVCRRPSDLGFDDEGFDLPELIEREVVIDAGRCGVGLLNLPAKTLEDQRRERRETIPDRCEKVAELVAGCDGPSVVWCHLNEEADLVEQMIPDALQVSGSMSEDKKEERLLAFQRGELRVLVTKPKIGCFGLNWQHCSNVVLFPSHSWEQYYQAVRRCWRFGQENPVTVSIVTTPGESRVLASLRRKAKQADEMFRRIAENTSRELLVDRGREFTDEEEVPVWLS